MMIILDEVEEMFAEGILDGEGGAGEHADIR